MVLPFIQGVFGMSVSSYGSLRQDFLDVIDFVEELSSPVQQELLLKGKKPLGKRLIQSCEREDYEKTLSYLASLQSRLIVKMNKDPANLDMTEVLNDRIFRLSQSLLVHAKDEKLNHTIQNHILKTPGFTPINQSLFKAGDRFYLFIHHGEIIVMSTLPTLGTGCFQFQDIKKVGFFNTNQKNLIHLKPPYIVFIDRNDFSHTHSLSDGKERFGRMVDRLTECVRGKTIREQFLSHGFEPMDNETNSREEYLIQVFDDTENPRTPDEIPCIAVLKKGKLVKILTPHPGVLPLSTHFSGNKFPYDLGAITKARQVKGNKAGVEVSILSDDFDSVAFFGASEADDYFQHLEVNPQLLEPPPNQQKEFARAVHTLNHFSISSVEEEMRGNEERFLGMNERLLSTMGWDHHVVNVVCGVSHADLSLREYLRHEDFGIGDPYQQERLYFLNKVKRYKSSSVLFHRNLSEFQSHKITVPIGTRKFFLDSRIAQTIEKYGFYGGRGSPYRISPIYLMQIFRIQPRWGTIPDYKYKAPDGSQYLDRTGFLYVDTITSPGQSYPKIRGMEIVYKEEPIVCQNQKVSLVMKGSKGLIHMVIKGEEKQTSYVLDPFDEIEVNGRKCIRAIPGKFHEDRPLWITRKMKKFRRG